MANRSYILVYVWTLYQPPFWNLCHLFNLTLRSIYIYNKYMTSYNASIQGHFCPSHSEIPGGFSVVRQDATLDGLADRPHFASQRFDL